MPSGTLPRRRSGPTLGRACGKPAQVSRPVTVDSAPQIWDAALDVIRAQVSTPIFRTWFQGIRPGNLEPSGLVLLVPSRFATEWLEPRYLPLISHAGAPAPST